MTTTDKVFALIAAALFALFVVGAFATFSATVAGWIVGISGFFCACLVSEAVDAEMSNR